MFVVYLIGFYGGWQAWAAGAGGGRWVPFVVWLGRRAHADPEALLWVAALLVIAGFLVRLWGSAYLSAPVVWSANALDNRLIVDGPFRFIRNPLYFGNNLQALGIGSLATPFGFAFIVICSFLFTGMLAAHEAGLMRARYGGVYERFRAQVPAMVPRLTPAHVEGSTRGKPSFASGLRSELFSLGLAMGTLCIALYGYATMEWVAVLWIGGWALQTVLRYGSRPTTEEAYRG